MYFLTYWLLPGGGREGGRESARRRAESLLEMAESLLEGGLRVCSKEGTQEVPRRRGRLNFLIT